ncbi:Integral membrane protein [Helicobacter sp. NHP19-003]|uniref:Integral membrane protein n=1 Tax=Helicobacter gastrocanis TaxID=2849641 RepID=A0ABN6I7Z9_9HELI|nr:PepSY domain-containing protein [Helicobacter sp. NHP19-003]BCZ17650.1 Integral membrane protein [Helicobacter sp. NHP19-003]
MMCIQSVYKFHALTSVFFLPFALLFALSGVAFLLDFNPNSGAQITSWSVPLVAKDKELGFLLDFLKQKHLALPSKIKPRKHREALIIGTASYEVSLSAKGNQSVITVIHRSFLGILMQVHKGKAGKLLEIFGIVFGVFLCLFYISGLLMGFKRKNTVSILSAFLLGTVVLGVLLALAL